MQDKTFRVLVQGQPRSYEKIEIERVIEFAEGEEVDQPSRTAVIVEIQAQLDEAISRDRALHNKQAQREQEEAEREQEERQRRYALAAEKHEAALVAQRAARVEQLGWSKLTISDDEVTLELYRFGLPSADLRAWPQIGDGALVKKGQEALLNGVAALPDGTFITARLLGKRSEEDDDEDDDEAADQVKLGDAVVDSPSGTTFTVEIFGPPPGYDDNDEDDEDEDEDEDEDDGGYNLDDTFL